MTEPVFGTLVSSWRVQQAALTALRAWMPTYLAAIERQEGLVGETLGRPENPLGYYPGVDYKSAGPGLETPSRLPVVIVTAKPYGRPEMTARAYNQDFRLGVACIVRGDTEEEALIRASLYGAASMLLGQVGALGGLAERTVMVEAPEVDFIDTEMGDRRLMRSLVVYDVHVPELLLQWGPSGETPAETPEIATPEGAPGQPPRVSSTKLTVDVEAEEL